MKLPLGRVVATKGAITEIGYSEILSALDRHSRCDWGIVCDEDKHTNDYAARNDERVLSAYLSSEGTKFWIITEWNRSVTTVLLPEEY